MEHYNSPIDIDRSTKLLERAKKMRRHSSDNFPFPWVVNETCNYGIFEKTTISAQQRELPYRVIHVLLIFIISGNNNTVDKK